MLSSTLFVALAALTLPLVAAQDGMYSKSSPVLQLNNKNYHKLITKSNQVSMVEFYAPWCGHCRNLKPHYEKAAKGLKDLAQVAALNCDAEENKSLCGSMGIQGFPTLKIVRPSKKPGKPIVEDYNGQREAKAIMEAVKQAIPNNVKRLTDKSLSGWFESDNATAKAILFSDKGTTSPLIKSLATEFLGKVAVATARDTEKRINKMFGVAEYPTLILLPGGEADPIKYEDAFTKKAMSAFLSDAAVSVKDKVKGKVSSVKSKVKGEAAPSADAEQESAFSKASAKHKEADASEAGGPSATAETLVDDDTPPTTSPGPAVTPDAKPIAVHVAAPIPTLAEAAELQHRCLGERTPTCLLALLSASVPSKDDGPELSADATTALSSLADLAEKHRERSKDQTGPSPFYAVPAANTAGQSVRTALDLDGAAVEIIAVNGRRGWWRRFNTSKGYALRQVEDWYDDIRFGEGTKSKLPDGVVVEVPEATATGEDATSTHAPDDDASATPVADEASSADTAAEPEAEPAADAADAAAAAAAADDHDDDDQQEEEEEKEEEKEGEPEPPQPIEHEEL